MNVYTTVQSKLSTLTQTHTLQALVLLGAMWEAGGELAPDTVSYNAALKACGSAGQIATALQVRPSAADYVRFTQLPRRLPYNKPQGLQFHWPDCTRHADGPTTF